MSNVSNLEIYRNDIGGDPLNRIIDVKRMNITVLGKSLNIYIKFIKIH